jgi:hypothetical protein
MFFVELLFAFIIALFLTVIFAGFRRSGPWASLFIFFLLVFLASWAGGLWMAPVGPRLWGAYWVPFLLVGLIFALLLAAMPPDRHSESSVELVEPKKAKKEQERLTTALGVFFWVLVIVLILAILARYLR